ncbi:hypothetical protein SAMN04488058_11915 [Deinococcus reticulitermitis]|uniref:Uncharacterized protein n=1 Tax=Deinococcus reticulitermitis TaxID=856736 RepID=A0A1H7BQY3_9DEIO|nr:hypothetical protein SAMN04488058_11915 [Deinococcus reticulitermitis]
MNTALFRALGLLSVAFLAACSQTTLPPVPDAPAPAPARLSAQSLTPTLSSLNLSGLSLEAQSLVLAPSGDAHQPVPDAQRLAEINAYVDRSGVPTLPPNAPLNAQGTAPGVADQYPWLRERSSRIAWAIGGSGHVLLRTAGAGKTLPTQLNPLSCTPVPSGSAGHWSSPLARSRSTVTMRRVRPESIRIGSLTGGRPGSRG